MSDKTSIRSPQDYAIEFGEYMASAAERYMAAVNTNLPPEAILKDQAAVTDAWVSLSSAVYEFRKRAARAKE